MGHTGSGLESQNLAEATLLREALSVLCVFWVTQTSWPEAFRTFQVHVGDMVCPHILLSDTDFHQSVTLQSGKQVAESLPNENTLWGASTVPPKARGNSRWTLGPETHQWLERATNTLFNLPACTRLCTQLLSTNRKRGLKIPASCETSVLL